MTYKITRTDKDADGHEVETLVAFTEDECEIGCIIDEDRHKIDWDAEYNVTQE